MTGAVKNITNSVGRYVDLKFCLKFICLFLLFYYFNLLFVHLTQPGEYYNKAVAENFNYIDWITASLSHTANFFSQLMGIETSVIANKMLVAETGHRLFVKWQCIGLGIFSFWLAFVLAQNISTRKKILFSVGGILAIWLLNCMRISLLQFALVHNFKELRDRWSFTSGMDHHDLYNYFCYALILVMMIVLINKTSRQKSKSNNS